MIRKHIVVFSGGSAANNLVDVFGKLAEDKGASLSYIIPISDNGGSSSELIRVFGGPGIGDIRSRLVRLIPENSSAEKTAIKTLFNHRLSSSDSVTARNEWLDIVEARHSLWSFISSEKRELIRSFLNTINLEIVKRARPSSVFNFQSASVGNLFLTGARIFIGSFEAAIYLLGAITGVPSNVHVIPAINSNFTHHISAGLRDGTIITGQNAISHPSEPGGAYTTTLTTPIPTESGTPLPNTSISVLPINHISLARKLTSVENEEHDKIEDANLPGSHPSLRLSSIHFSKTNVTSLSTPIERIWYINPYGQEIRPAPNPKVSSSIDDASCIIYCIGSLYTSILPCLVLRDVGEAIARCPVKYKILILNGSLDRETKTEHKHYGAMDFIAAIADACETSRVALPSVAPKEEWKSYATHVIHLAGTGTPKVEKQELQALGIECMRIYGRNSKGGMKYDGSALGQALEAIIGKGDSKGLEKTRRNTLGIVGPNA